jgi:NhaA family Na+:H+ antiporter
MNSEKPEATTLGRAILKPLRASLLQDFLQTEASGGILLLLCAVVALAWANSPYAHLYFELWEQTITIGAGRAVISKSLLHWINDGLMALFFFVVGLEIKREVISGELNTARKAALPIAAAAGGMIVPALIYLLVNRGTANLHGWGVPMATDIAFALGVLALLGSRVPFALKVFLAAIAIVDDLGAVLVIAFFYTNSVSWPALLAAAGCFAALLALNKLGARHAALYAVVGVCLWLAVLQSGVHATIAGLLVALAVPGRRRIDAASFLHRGRDLMDEFAHDLRADESEPTSAQQDAVFSLEEACEQVQTPLARFEHELNPWVAYLIVPLFALANAGVALQGGLGAALGSPVTMGVALGLLIGKPIGVTLASWLAVKIGLATLPEEVHWRHIGGVACLCGIGFTMALFISGLAFGDAAHMDSAKIGILAGSLLSGLLGWALLRRNGQMPEQSVANE